MPVEDAPVISCDGDKREDGEVERTREKLLKEKAERLGWKDP